MAKTVNDIVEGYCKKGLPPLPLQIVIIYSRVSFQYQ